MTLNGKEIDPEKVEPDVYWMRRNPGFEPIDISRAYHGKNVCQRFGLEGEWILAETKDIALIGPIEWPKEGEAE